MHVLRFFQLAVLTILFFGVQGCKNVQPSDLIGTWLVKDSSRQVLPPELQKVAGRIVVDANGTFAMSDIPGLFYSPGQRAVRLESGSGVWKLVSREGKQQVQLDFRAIADWKESDLPYGTQLGVSKGWSAVSLFYFIGDADEGRRIDLERK